jgi:hypothetical protein
MRRLPFSATEGSTGPVTLTPDQFSELLKAIRSPTPALLTDEQGAERLGVSLRKFHELRHESWFPRAIVLGPRHKRYSTEQLDACIPNIPREQTPAPEPLQLAKGRAARAGKTEIK